MKPVTPAVAGIKYMSSPDDDSVSEYSCAGVGGCAPCVASDKDKEVSSLQGVAEGLGDQSYSIQWRGSILTVSASTAGRIPAAARLSLGVDS